MDQDLPVRQRAALPLRAPGEQNGADRHGDPDAHRAHVRLDELHRVVDREPGVDVAARRVDVERDVVLGILGLEMEELRVHDVRDLVVDLGAEKDDALIEEARVDVERALAAARLLDHCRHERAHAATTSLARVGAPTTSTGTP